MSRSIAPVPARGSRSILCHRSVAILVSSRLQEGPGSRAAWASHCSAHPTERERGRSGVDVDQLLDAQTGADAFDHFLGVEIDADRVFVGPRAPPHIVLPLGGGGEI